MRLFKIVAGALLGAGASYLVCAWLWLDFYSPFMPTKESDIFNGTRYVMLVGAFVGAAYAATTTSTH